MCEFCQTHTSFSVEGIEKKETIKFCPVCGSILAIKDRYKTLHYTISFWPVNGQKGTEQIYSSPEAIDFAEQKRKNGYTVRIEKVFGNIDNMD